MRFGYFFAQMGLTKSGATQIFISYFANNTNKYFGWKDISIDPPACEALFCAIRGQSTNDNNEPYLSELEGS